MVQVLSAKVSEYQQQCGRDKYHSNVQTLEHWRVSHCRGNLRGNQSDLTTSLTRTRTLVRPGLLLSVPFTPSRGRNT